jgi:hypothetical protein
MTSLQGFKDAEELAMISKQRMTGTGSVFDISQFKLAVEQDVSTDTIEKLQAEFGQDMAGGKNALRLFLIVLVVLTPHIDSHWQISWQEAKVNEQSC